MTQESNETERERLHWGRESKYILRSVCSLRTRPCGRQSLRARVTHHVTALICWIACDEWTQMNWTWCSTELRVWRCVLHITWMKFHWTFWEGKNLKRFPHMCFCTVWWFGSQIGFKPATPCRLIKHSSNYNKSNTFTREMHHLI